MFTKKMVTWAVIGFCVIFTSVCFWGCNVVNKNKVDVGKFEPLVRAASKVKASANVGMDFRQFGQYIQEYATEVEIIKNKVSSDKEKEILNYFSNALEIYNDSKIIWNCKNNDPVRASLEQYGAAATGGKIWLAPGGVVIDELNAIVQKYKLEVHEHGGDKTISENSIPQLWSEASKLIDAANASLQQSAK
jgi:hypothetical protein